jgi:hypothetical protein
VLGKIHWEVAIPNVAPEQIELVFPEQLDGVGVEAHQPFLLCGADTSYAPMNIVES